MRFVIISLLFTAVIGVSSVSAEDGNYTLDVQFNNIPDSVQFTLRTDGDSVIYRQKVRTLDNMLHFSLNISEDYPVPLYLTGKNPNDKKDSFFVSFYGGKGIHHRVTSAGVGFSDREVTFDGAPWDDVKNEMERSYADYYNRFKELSAKIDATTVLTDSVNKRSTVVDYVEYARLSNERRKAQDEHFAARDAMILANPQSPDAIHNTSFLYNSVKREQLVDFAEKVPQGLRGMPEYATLMKFIDMPKIKFMSKLENFDLVGEDFDGAPVRLSQFTTPFILVEFNSFGCGACRSAAKEEIPQILKEHGDRITFVSYSTDEDREMMAKTHEKDNGTWPTIWNGSGSKGDDCIKYKVNSYPSFFLFGPERTLLTKWTGWGPGSIAKCLELFLE